MGRGVQHRSTAPIAGRCDTGAEVPAARKRHAAPLLALELGAARQDRTGAAWVCRRVACNGVISVAWQQICVGAHHSGESVDVHVTGPDPEVWSGSELIKTVARTTPGKQVRKKRASIRRTT